MSFFQWIFSYTLPPLSHSIHGCSFLVYFSFPVAAVALHASPEMLLNR